MGLGFSVEAAVPARGMFRRKPGRDRLFSNIRDAIHEYVDDPLMARMLRASSRDHTLSVVLHPCAEPVEFLWSPNQSLRASAKTSTVGPGYHAHVIEMLRQIGTTLKLDWNWRAEDADETGFARTGDFSALQCEMAKLWGFFAQLLLERAAEDNEHLMLNMPLGFPVPQLDTFAVTPLGPLSRACCESVQSGNGCNPILR
jgi:hypothetical protein